TVPSLSFLVQEGRSSASQRTCQEVWERTGDREGLMERDRFAGLVAPHTGAMAWTAASLVGLADAEDAAQEALLRAWNGWETLREECAVRAWLLRITVNVCHNWQDGRFGSQRRFSVPLSSILDEAPEVAARLTTPGPETRDHEAMDLR